MITGVKNALENQGYDVHMRNGQDGEEWKSWKEEWKSYAKDAILVVCLTKSDYWKSDHCKAEYNFWHDDRNDVNCVTVNITGKTANQIVTEIEEAL